MIVELTNYWEGWGPGHRFPLMPKPVAEILVKRGLARFVEDELRTEDRSDNGTGNGTANNSRRKKARRASK